MPTPPSSDGQDGIDVTGGGQPPTGDPFLDEARREAAEDAAAGSPRGADWIMARAEELFERANPDDEKIKPRFVDRDYVSEMVEDGIADAMRANGWVPREQFEEEVQQRVAENLAAGGWVHQNALEGQIEKAADAISAKDRREQALITLRTMKAFGIAALNALLLIFLPEPYKNWYGLGFTLFALWWALRLTREMNVMIKKSEAQLKGPAIEKVSDSTIFAEEIVRKRGIKRSTFDLVEDSREIKLNGCLLTDKTITELRAKLGLKTP